MKSIQASRKVSIHADTSKLVSNGRAMPVSDLPSMVTLQSALSGVRRTLLGACDESSLKSFLNLIAEVRVTDDINPHEMENIKLRFSASAYVSGCGFSSFQLVLETSYVYFADFILEKRTMRFSQGVVVEHNLYGTEITMEDSIAVAAH